MTSARSLRLKTAASLIIAVTLCLSGRTAISANPSPLHEAAQAGDIEQVRALIDAGADLNAKDARGYTPLHYAAMYGHDGVAASLLAGGADASASDKYGWTPLHLAVRYGYEDVVELLVEAGADVNAEAVWQNTTPLDEAAGNDDPVIAHLLVTYGAEVNSQNAAGVTPLYRAAWQGHYRVVEVLIANGADPTLADNSGNTPLHAAATSLNTDTVGCLIAHGAEVNAVNNSSLTPLHYAAQSGYLPVVRVLVDGGANSNSKSASGVTPAFMAAKVNCRKIAAFLLSKGSDLNLHLAAYFGLTEQAGSLTAAGENVNTPDMHMGTPLHVASREGYGDIAQLLISNGAAVDARWVRWSLPGDTPLHEAVRYNRPDVIAVLLASGADIEAEVWYRSTPLELAVRCGAWEAARLLVAQGAAATIHHAAHLGDTDLVRRLIDAGADIDALDSYYETPLHIAAQAGWTDVATLLLSRGARVDTPTEVSRETPLHYASEHGQTEVAGLLLSHGADIHAKTRSLKSTPLRNAVIYGHAETARLLLAHGADVHAEDKHGHTPLCEAAIISDLEMAEFLLAHGADINGRPGNRWTFGGTPLHEAIYYGHTEMAAFLLARGADAGTTAGKGATALDYAIKQSFPDVVALLGGNANDPALANREPWTVIVTDPQGVREFLSFEGIDYDEAWIPQEADIEGLESSLRSYLLQNANIGSWMWFDRPYVLANLRSYNRECSGFVLDDSRYIICSMILSGPFQGSAYIAGRDGPPGTSFTIIFDGGCAIVRVIFDAETKAVVGIACNGMA